MKYVIILEERVQKSLRLAIDLNWLSLKFKIIIMWNNLHQW